MTFVENYAYVIIIILTLVVILFAADGLVKWLLCLMAYQPFLVYLMPKPFS